MSTKERTKKKEEPRPDHLSIDFVRSPAFRVIHADGAFGGTTTQGFLAATFYSERTAVPRRLVCDVASDGTLGPERRQNPDDFTLLREEETCIFMTFKVAKQLRDWLDRHIKRQSEMESD